MASANDEMVTWPTGRLDFSSGALVMGVLNVTPDSFSDGGRFEAPDAALEQALKMQQDGAAIIDIGGESTRPGAAAVTLQQELDRVLPVIEVLSAELDIPISIDTSKPGVMSAAVAAGAGMINDVNALNAEGAVQAALDAAVNPIRQFMFKQTREKDLALFVNMTAMEKPKDPKDIPTSILIPAFIISELKTAFIIGFVLYVPFLIIDMVVASVLLSMGMMMLPPILVSLPFKLMLFVLVDGWRLMVGSLVKSFVGG